MRNDAANGIPAGTTEQEAMDDKWPVPAEVVVIEATHGFMTGRGVRTHGVAMTTNRKIDTFRNDPRSRREMLALEG